MIKTKWQRFVAAPLVATLLMTGFAPLAMAADTADTAAVAQQVTAATEVNGTLTGGQFDKIWLGLTPDNPGDVTVRVEWDRDNADGNGVGFFVLNPGNLSAVVNGSSLQGNNVGAGSSNFFLNGPSNVQGAQFRATGPEYTVVLFNDSAQDANFKLSVTNGTVATDSTKVTAPGQATAEATAAATDGAAATPAASTTATDTVTTTTTAPAATDATTATVAAEATAVATAVATATAAAPAAVAAPAGPVRAETMEGSLPNQFDQHFLALEPSIKDGDITLDLTYDPQDNVDLARRINFWVLDQNGFTRYQDGDSPSSVAIAAGSKSFLDPDTSNRRTASFKATGFGPYTVIVQNNSKVPATYTLTANGGVLIDDSAQTITAQQAGGVAATGTTTGTTTVAAAAPAATGTTTTTVAAGTGRAGEPGGTYTVASGDTLALIARDIYGDYRLYEQLCAFNKIADCNVIEVGQTINLPTNEQIGATGTAAAAATPAATTAAAAATPAASVAATTTATTTAAAATSAVTTTAGVTTTAPVTGTGTTTTTTRPATTGTTTTTAAAGSTSAAASGSVLQTLESSGNYTILLAALKQAGLDSQLSGAGPVTVFAPTDAAFQKLLTKSNLTKEQLLQVPELSAILKYHVLPTKLLAADITNGFQATTLQGSPVTFTVNGSNVKVNDSNIVGADVNATNGVIHSIDDVMLVNPG